jgi:hypothetical protein
VIECAPAVSDWLISVAVPLPSVSIVRVAVPSLIVTVPVGVPEPEALTVTVKFVGWVTSVGFTKLVIIVWVATGWAFLTVCVTTVDVVPVKLESPL